MPSNPIEFRPIPSRRVQFKLGFVSPRPILSLVVNHVNPCELLSLNRNMTVHVKYGGAAKPVALHPARG